jgi:hypothetical protein
LRLLLPLGLTTNLLRKLTRPASAAASPTKSQQQQREDYIPVIKTDPEDADLPDRKSTKKEVARFHFVSF